MAKRGGFPGGGMPGNMNNLMKQAQRMQRQMEEAQKELEEKEFSATAGGGAVEVTVSGKKVVTKVKLDKDAVDPDDVEIGTVIVVKPGERIPLDGIVVEGESMVDTAALTGESVPRRAAEGDEIISGCVNNI